MVVTISTDASYSFKHKIGSYAFWIKCDQGKLTMSGKLRKKILRAEVAEIMCIFNALHTLHVNKQMFTPAKHIIVNTDCLNAIHVLTGDTKSIRMYKLGIMAGYRGLFNRDVKPLFKGKKIEFRHVKAHEGIDTPRKYVNDWCDTAAKQQIQEFINQKEKA